MYTPKFFMLAVSFAATLGGCAVEVGDQPMTSDITDYSDEGQDQGNPQDQDDAESIDEEYYSALLGLYLVDEGVMDQVMAACMAQAAASGETILFSEMDLSPYVAVPSFEELNAVYSPDVVEELPSVTLDPELPEPPTVSTNICSKNCSKTYYANCVYGYYKTSRAPCSSTYTHYLANSCTTSSYCSY